MALTSPLPASQFLDLFHVAEAIFTIDWRQQMSGDGASEDIYAGRAPARYIANITTGDLTHAQAEGVKARLMALQGGMKNVLLYDSGLRYPANDPTGSIWTGAAPSMVVGTFTDRTHAAFSGAPHSYGPVLYGTYFSVLYDTDRVYLGQFAETWTSNGSGVVAAVEFSPPMPAGITAGAAVSMLKPVGKFRIDPSTIRPSVTSGKHKRLTWTATQTYRRG